MPPRTFTIGPLAFRFEAPHAFARRITFHGHEALRGIYVAARDAHWGTPGPEVLDVQVSESPDKLLITQQARVDRDGVALEWRAELVAEASGRLTYRFKARALRDCLTARTGICVLHPAEATGAPGWIEHTNGPRRLARLPFAVEPHQPFFDLRGIGHVFAPGASAEVRFEGDVFEMEDQRNWSDASFKTYSRPLAWTKPYALRGGEEVVQSVTLTFVGTPTVAARAEGAVTLSLGDSVLPLPALGSGLGPDPLVPAERERVRSLGLDHVRVELATEDPRWRERLASARDTAKALGVVLQAALRTDHWPAEASTMPDVRWSLFSPQGGLAEPSLLARAASGAGLGSGTCFDYVQFNRHRPTAAHRLGAAHFGLNAQVHAFDDLSLLETLTQHGVLVRAARACVAPSLPIAVGPIVLGPKWDSADPRLRTAFAAAWLLGSLAQLGAARAAAATYFETHGARGFVQDGALTPAGIVLRALNVFRGGMSHALTSSDPLRVTALLVSGGKRQRALVANATTEPVEVHLPFAAPAKVLVGLAPIATTAGGCVFAAGSIYQFDW